MRDHSPKGTQFCPECGNELKIVYPAQFDKYWTCGVRRYNSSNGWINGRIEDNHSITSVPNLKVLGLLKKAIQQFGGYVALNGLEAYGYDGFLGVVHPYIVVQQLQSRKPVR